LTFAEKSLDTLSGWPFLWFAMIAGSMARDGRFVKKDKQSLQDEGIP